jgi:hypothetical protein
VAVRLFVRFDKTGTVIAASKVAYMADGLDHPHGALEPGEDVLEVKPTPEQEALDAHELMERYSVDVKKRKLQKRRVPPQPSR